ncbi:hypothetical protein [Persephonella sp. IF05-L8]|uniref:hypothetical protein n=1 Tax=Persephonella sp. IF05-L8 TaxID=1158338 RepID=UPI000496FD7C
MPYIENIEELVQRYRELHNEDIKTFVKNQKELARTALDIFIKIAEISNLGLKTVVLESKMFKKAYESMKVLTEASTIPSIPEYGDVKISNAEGTVIFLDITKSTRYFEEKKNYTGFVIFNAYILLVKTTTRLTDGEFLEHTGDGAMIFYKNKNIKEDYENCRSFNERDPICLYFILSEHLKNYAKEKELLIFDREEVKPSKYKEPSLIHVGADYGEILEVNLGNIKKLISKTVWNAANKCKNADRIVEYEEEKEKKTYHRLPIKT